METVNWLTQQGNGQNHTEYWLKVDEQPCTVSSDLNQLAKTASINSYFSHKFGFG